MSAPPAFAAVVFDCDSTLASIEGIEALCAGLPRERREEVEALTNAAMDGVVHLADVYERRLRIARPSRADLDAVGRAYVAHLVPRAREVVGALQAGGVSVGIVSGGLEPAVRWLARDLGLPDEAVHAVGVRFAADGSYEDFDRASPLWRNRGKVEVLAALRARTAPLLFVGDGVTDLEAQDVVDLFVGYGGVVRRTAVERGAAVYRTDPDLAFVLDLVFPSRPGSDACPRPTRE